MNKFAQHYADPRFLDTTALARRWDVSPRTVEGWRHRGIGPPWRKFGGHIRYFMGDILAFESESLITSSRSSNARASETEVASACLLERRRGTNDDG